MPSLARWNRLYLNTKIHYSAYRASQPIGIFFPHEHPASKYVTIKTISVLS